MIFLSLQFSLVLVISFIISIVIHSIIVNLCCLFTKKKYQHEWKIVGVTHIVTSIIYLTIIFVLSIGDLLK